MDTLAGKAFFIGVISAASLPLGAVTAMWWTPRQRAVAGMMAFGAGALLAALSLDLVANTVRIGAFYPLAAGCLIGCGLFAALNHLVNSRGGFLRNAAATVRYLTKAKSEHVRSLAARLSAVSLFQRLPPQVIADLLPQVQERTYRSGTTIVRQGEPGDSFFVIEQGEIDVIDDRAGGRIIRTLSDGDVFGELALLTGESRSASAVATKDARVWVILKEQFDRLLESSPALAQAVRNIAANRIDLGDGAHARERDVWARTATRDLEDKIAAPTEAEIKEAVHANKSAPLAIFLGVLLDGIPESLVIGSSALQAELSLSLLAGLFLSNFPEAMGSAVGMRYQGYRGTSIIAMWAGLMLFTGAGASFGATFLTHVSTAHFAIIEGVAAGAMLTMVAETMLPEAYHKGGAITGVSTLLGFLAAIFFKTLE